MSILFLDTEFTGLYKHTELISLAIYENDENYFYAEFNDYDPKRLTLWLEQNVLSKLEYQNLQDFYAETNHKKILRIKDDSINIAAALWDWLSAYPQVEIWADVSAYDWVLFCELFGGALKIPDNIFYAPFDLATLLRSKAMINPQRGYEGEASKFVLSGTEVSKQYHALEDAKVESRIYYNIMKDE